MRGTRKDRAVQAVLFDFVGVFMPSPFAAVRAFSARQGIAAPGHREVAQQVCIFLLMLLMVYAFYNDIARFFEKQVGG